MANLPLDIKPTVNLDTFEAPEPSVVNLDVGSSLSNPPSLENAQTRAKKYLFSRPSLNIPYDQLVQDLANGQEDSLKNYAASQIREERALRASQMAVEASKRKGGPLTPEEAGFIMDLAKDNYETDPETVFDVAYGKEYMKYAEIAFPGQGNLVQEASAKFPKQMEAVKVEALNITAKAEIAKRNLQDAVQTAEEQSWPGFIADSLKRLVPGYTSVKLRGNAPGVGFFEGGFLGDNLTKQADALMKIRDVTEFNKQLKTIMDKLKNDNPSIAAEFAKILVDRSTSDELVDNLSEILDIAMAPIGLGIRSPKKAKGTKAAETAGETTVKVVTKEEVKLLEDATEAVKDVVKSNKGTELNKAAAQEASGDVGEAAVTRAAKNLEEDLTVEGKSTNRLIEPLLTGFRADISDLKNNTGRLSRELLVRIEDAYNRTTEGLVDLFKNGARVDRLPELNDKTIALRVLKEKLAGDYPGLEGNMLDMYLRPVAGANTREYVYEFGKPGAELFQNWTQANNYAKAQGLVGYKIDRKGNGFYISVTTPLDETAPSIRAVIGTTSETQTPDNFMKQFLDNLRTPEDTLSKADAAQRKIATYGTNPYFKLIQETTKDINTLAKANPFFKKQYWNDFERMIKFARTAPDPETGEPGYFFRFGSEIEDFYQRYIGRNPTDVEVEAYFGYKRAYEIDRSLINLATVRNMERAGVQKVTLTVPDETGKLVDGPTFNGKKLKELPNTQSAIAIIGEKQGLERVHIFQTPTKALKDWQKRVASGEYQAYELYDRGARPLAGWGKIENQRIGYVLVKNAKIAPVDAVQVPRRGGGHWVYDYDHYIKQAKMVPERIGNSFRYWYEGDTTIMPIAIKAMGDDAVKHLNNIRELLLKKDIAGAKAYTQKHAFLDFDTIYGWFRDKRVDGQKIPAMLSLKEPIKLVPKGKKINDLDTDLSSRYGNFKNGETDGLARANTIEFAGERNSYELQTMTNEGTKDNPLFKFAPAKFVDPIPTMDRALTRIVNSAFIDDYKIMSIEHWLKQAETHIEALSGSVWDAPFYHYFHPNYKKATDSIELAKLESMRAQMSQFIGTPSKTDTLLYASASKLADKIYQKTGKTSYMGIDPEWMLPKLTDPFRFARAVTFHSAMGLFSIPQLFVQANTFTNILAVAGARHTVSGTSAAMMAGWLNLNKHPNIIGHLDKQLSKLKIPGVSGWQEGEFKEAYEALMRSGFGNVAGEYSLRDSTHTPQIFKSRGKEFLDLGAMAFTMGEKSVRYGAWFTAYKEFREGKPLGRLTQQDVRKILDRADLLSVNMSRASNSRIHEGIFSIPTQFLTYGIRMGELFWGKRLGETTLERTKVRARILGWNAALYGVPMAGGVTGFPAGDALKEAWISRTGYTPGLDNYVQSTVMEGIPAMLIALATGNQVNFGERYGVGGFEQVRDFLSGDKDWLDLVGGAAFSKFRGAISASDPLYRVVTSMMTGDGEAFPFQVEDLAAPLREISTVHSSLRLAAALNTGDLLSKRGKKLTDVSAGEAWTQFITGLSPSRMSDTQIISKLQGEQKELEKFVSDRFVQEFIKGMRVSKDNPQQAEEYFKRAIAYTKVGGIRPDLYSSLVSRAITGNESLESSVNWSFFIKNAPDELKQQYIDAFTRRQQRNQ